VWAHSYHMHIEEAGLAQAVETAGAHLGYVHIGESHRGHLGTGNIDFPQLFRCTPTIVVGVDARDCRTHVLLYLALGRWPSWATRAPSPSSRSRRAWSPPRSPTRFVSGGTRGRTPRWVCDASPRMLWSSVSKAINARTGCRC
jgi:hypothetical protein